MKIANVNGDQSSKSFLVGLRHGQVKPESNAKWQHKKLIITKQHKPQCL